MKQKTIMIVNDSLLFVNMMVEVLSKQGYNCVQAFSSDEAFQIYFDKKPDLVLMDIFMPSKNGIECTKDGIECTKDIMRFDPKASIIIFCMIEPKYVYLALEAGAQDIIAAGFQNYANLHMKFCKVFSSVRSYDLNSVKRKLLKFNDIELLSQDVIDDILYSSIMIDC